MVVLRPDTEEQARIAIIDRAKEIITADGGIMGKVDEWGKRRLAYEIDHMTEGFYFVMYFHAEPKALDEVMRVFKISDAVIRAMPIKLDTPAPVIAPVPVTEPVLVTEPEPELVPAAAAATPQE
jgi:small subunit ribosomal protein S6